MSSGIGNTGPSPYAFDSFYGSSSSYHLEQIDLVDLLIQNGAAAGIHLSLDDPETIKNELKVILANLLESNKPALERTINEKFGDLHDLYMEMLSMHICGHCYFEAYLDKFANCLLAHPTFILTFSNHDVLSPRSESEKNLSISDLQDCLRETMTNAIGDRNYFPVQDIIEEKPYLKTAVLSLSIISIIMESKELENAIRLTPTKILSMENAPPMLKQFADILIPLREELIKLSRNDEKTLKQLYVDGNSTSSSCPPELVELKNTIDFISDHIQTMSEFKNISEDVVLNEMLRVSESSSTDPSI